MYEVEVKTKDKDLKFKSVGGLNKGTASASFRLGNSAPSAPTSMLPVNNTATDNMTVSLNCSNSVDPDGDTLSYSFQLDSSNPPSTVVCANASGDCDYNGSGSNGYFWWRCQADDGYDGTPFLAHQCRERISENIPNSHVHFS